MATGAIESIVGGSTAAGGGTITLTGAGAVVGVPAVAAGVGLATHGIAVSGTALKNLNANARVDQSGTASSGDSGKPSLSEHKEALGQVHAEVGKQPKGDPGKFGSPQAGDSKKGYRLDPAQPNAKPGTAETQTHINWWDYTQGKKNNGGRSGAVPVGPPKPPQ